MQTKQYDDRPEARDLHAVPPEREEETRGAMDDKQAPTEGDEKDHPAGKLVEKAQGFVRVPILDAQPVPKMRTALAAIAMGMLARARTARRQVGLLEKVTIENRKGKQAHQGADAATGLGHLQPHGWKLNDVALAQHRHAEQRSRCCWPA